MTSEQYYRYVRREVFCYLPEKVERVLELGCGAGATLAAIKEAHPGCQTFGVELCEQPALAARSVVDQVFCGNAEQADFAQNLGIAPHSLDAILCLDVLEHLVDPWAMVARLSTLLKPGGVLVSSIPNVRFLPVLLHLVCRGDWHYQAAGGILDATHLRFFTKKTACQLFIGAGLEITAIGATGLEPGRKAWFANVATAGLFRDFFVYQYLIAAQLPAA